MSEQEKKFMSFLSNLRLEFSSTGDLHRVNECIIPNNKVLVILLAKEISHSEYSGDIYPGSYFFSQLVGMNIHNFCLAAKRAKKLKNKGGL